MKQTTNTGHHRQFSPIQFLMQVLWPAFLGAAMMSGLVFSIIDPLELDIVYELLQQSRELAYTVGFLVFWLVISFCCAFTWYLVATESRKRSRDDSHND